MNVAQTRGPVTGQAVMPQNGHSNGTARSGGLVHTSPPPKIGDSVSPNSEPDVAEPTPTRWLGRLFGLRRLPSWQSESLRQAVELYRAGYLNAAAVMCRIHIERTLRRECGCRGFERGDGDLRYGHDAYLFLRGEGVLSNWWCSKLKKAIEIASKAAHGQPPSTYAVRWLISVCRHLTAHIARARVIEEPAELLSGPDALVALVKGGTT